MWKYAFICSAVISIYVLNARIKLDSAERNELGAVHIKEYATMNFVFANQIFMNGLIWHRIWERLNYQSLYTNMNEIILRVW